MLHVSVSTMVMLMRLTFISSPMCLMPLPRLTFHRHRGATGVHARLRRRSGSGDVRARLLAMCFPIARVAFGGLTLPLLLIASVIAPTVQGMVMMPSM